MFFLSQETNKLSIKNELKRKKKYFSFNYSTNYKCRQLKH